MGSQVRQFRYSVDQLKTLFDAIQEDELYPLIKITALYGLRRSEVLGLKWDSVDFEGNRLTIKHTVARSRRTMYPRISRCCSTTDARSRMCRSTWDTRTFR